MTILLIRIRMEFASKCAYLHFFLSFFLNQPIHAQIASPGGSLSDGEEHDELAVEPDSVAAKIKEHQEALRRLEEDTPSSPVTIGCFSVDCSSVKQKVCFRFICCVYSICTYINYSVDGFPIRQ